MATLTHHPVFVQTTRDKLPPLQNEPNQAEIDAETAHRLREAAQERCEQQKPQKFVTVVPDGQVYRWQRKAGPGTTFVSREAFTTLAAAISAAVSVAQCYGVPALVPGAG